MEIDQQHKPFKQKNGDLPWCGRHDCTYLPLGYPRRKLYPHPSLRILSPLIHPTDRSISNEAHLTNDATTLNRSSRRFFQCCKCASQARCQYSTPVLHETRATTVRRWSADFRVTGCHFPRVFAHPGGHFNITRVSVGSTPSCCLPLDEIR